MRTARFFVPEEWIAKTSEAFAIPAGSTYKQIVSVLRMKAGDPLSLMTNDGTEIDVRITDITPSAVLGVIAGSMVSDLLKPEVTVCFAMLKNDRTELILQKCTELGATAFLPMVTERAIKKVRDVSSRWHAIVKEAAEQSGRTTIPAVHDPATFAEAIGKTDGMRRIVLHEPRITVDHGVKHIMHKGDAGALPTVSRDDRVALFVGPEGGFTEHEIALARDAASHIVHLGDPSTGSGQALVLRAETAAIAGMALIRLQQ